MANTNFETLFARGLNHLDLTDKQKRVLISSLTLFSQKGYDRTSTSDIAKMAGVSEGTVYKQFNTKHDILQAIIDPFIREVLPVASSEFVTTVINAEAVDFPSFLKNIIQNRLQFAVENLPQLRILMRESLTDSDLLNQVWHAVNQQVIGRVADKFKSYQQSGDLVDWPVTKIVWQLFVVMMGYVYPLILAPQKRLDIDKASAEAVDFLLNGLRPRK